MLAVSPAGDFIDLAVPDGARGFPAVAAGTRALAWRGDGVWVSALNSSLEQPPQQIFAERTGAVQWTPDGADLLFVTAGGALYVARGPDYEPAPAGQVGGVSSAAWVLP
jgi:hypothetical protein